MTGERWRMVHVHNGEEHVNSVVLAEDEVAEHMDWEQEIHEVAGWQVERIYIIGHRFPYLLCVRGKSARQIRAQCFSPLDDGLTDAAGVAPSPRPGRSTPGGAG